MLFLILMLSCALNRFNPGSKGIMEDIDKVIQSPSQENAEAVLSNLNSKYSYKVYEKLIDTGDTRFFNHIPKEFLRHGLLLKIRKNKNIELERMFLDRIKATELERLVVEGKADEINDKSKEWLIKNYKYREEAVGTAGILFIYEKEELVKKLLDKLKEERKDLGNQILLSASKVGNCGLIEHLLESNLANNINDGFLLAAENGHKDICELLIDKGADINVVNNKICESNSRDNQEMRESRASLNEKTDNNCEFVYKWYEGPTALGYAAKNGHRNVCELLLDRGADIDIRDIEGMTALIHAAENGHKEVCELLIDKGAGVNIKINKERIGEKATSLPWFAFLLPQRINSLCENKMGLTALIFAAKNGHKEVCELLIDRGAEVDAEFRKDVEQLCLTKGYLGNYSEDPKIEKKYQEWGITALIYAAQNGHLEVCKLLLDKGASVHAKVNKKGEDALCSKDSECPDNSEMEYGATALMYAAYKGRKEVCTLLLDRGAKVDMADEDGWTALMIVAWEGYKEICELLIERGAKVDIANKDGCIPLMLGAWKGHREVCELLIDKGTKIDTVNKNGRTTLMFGACGGHKEVCELLLERGVEIDAVDKDKWTALMFGAHRGHKEVCELLLERGVKIDAVDKDKWTSLMFGASGGHKEVCELLIERGAKVDAVDKDGWTALMLGALEGRKEVCELLIDKGAKLDVLAGSGTALNLAVNNEFTEVCELLIERGADLKHISQTQIAVKLKLIKDNILHLDEESLEKGKSINLIRILEKKIVEGKNLREILEDTREKRKRQGLSDEWKDAVDELVNKIVANEGDNMKERVENERLEKMLIKNCLMKEVIKIKEESIIKNEKREHEKDSLRHVRKKLGCDESVDRSK